MKGERKQRSDKKRDVKPTVNFEVKDAIYRLAYLTKTTVKDTCEQMIKFAMNDVESIDNLSQHFRRAIRINQTFHNGKPSNIPIDKRLQDGGERMTTRLTEYDFEILNAYAYALDVRPARAAAVLIDIAIRDYRFVNNYVMRYLHGEISKEDAKELREILRYMNRVTGEHHTMASLLGAIVDEVSSPIIRIKDAVNEFVIKHWRD